MKCSFCPTCPPCPCPALLGLQVELGGLLGTGWLFCALHPCSAGMSLLIKLAALHESLPFCFLSRVTLHTSLCGCPFLTPSLPRASPRCRGVSWAGPGAAKPCFLMEQSTDYFGSNNAEMSFSKSLVAPLGSKGLFYC